MDERLLQFDFEWREGNRTLATDIAVAYVNDHFEQLDELIGHMHVDELVHLVDNYRAAGRIADRIITDMWIIARIPKRHITGTINVGASEVVEAVEAHLRGQ